jgi:hypothetical protein
MPAGAVTVRILGDASSLKKSLGQAETQVEGFGGKAAKMGKIVGGALAGAAILSFGRDAVTAYNEATQSQSKLNTALANSPATVGVTAKAFEQYNKTLAKKTLVDDDALASGQAVLAGFGLTEDQLKQVTPLLADYAAKTGKDIPSAAADIGKALLGQGRALKGVGVELVDTGTLGGNFTQIMDKVGAKVKGSAQAQLDAAGPGAKFKKSMDELQETVGGLLVPALSKLAEVAVGVVDFFTALPGPAKILIGVIGALAAAVYVLNAAQKAWIAVQAALNIVLTANPIGIVVVAIGLLVAALVLAYTKSETFRDVVKRVFEAVVNTVGDAVGWILDGIAKFLGGLAKVAEAASHIPGIGDKFDGVAESVRGAQHDVEGWADAAHKGIDLVASDAERAATNIAEMVRLGKLTFVPSAGPPVPLLPGVAGPPVPVGNYVPSASVTTNNITINAPQQADPTHIARRVMWELN